jgi:hypothetical protein
VALVWQFGNCHSKMLAIWRKVRSRLWMIGSRRCEQNARACHLKNCSTYARNSATEESETTRKTRAAQPAGR